MNRRILSDEDARSRPQDKMSKDVYPVGQRGGESEIEEAVAIVGIGCRFPGNAGSPADFWRLLVNQVNAVGEVPPERFDIDRYYRPETPAPGKILSRWGGFLESIDHFDAAFFGISPREAERLDPQQRLLLEVAWEAVEDAGQVPNSPALKQAGVYIGAWLHDYEARLFKDPHQADFYMTTGGGGYAASGRLSYVLGAEGPSLTLDTACSSSLVAVHLACQSLRQGECSLALAGGVNVILQPHISIAYSQSKMLAPDGRCKFGDAAADGYVRSEGCGVVALKPLRAALAEGDRIYAVILGSAVNNDGRSSGYLSTPARAGQEALLRRAYAAAGVSPGQVQYVEAHGTGTRAGDPVEIEALGNVLQEGRPEGQVCRIGSVKTNLGHTEGAAGVAGLIKVALSLHHRVLPPSLHFQEPNPAIPWERLPVRVQDRLTPWPEHSGPALAGVSAFGIAGTNAHVVLSEAPSAAQGSRRPLPGGRAAYLLPLSAHSPEALTGLAAAYRDLAASEEAAPLHDLAYTASARRTHHNYRLALAAASLPELEQALASALEEGITPEDAGERARRKILFLFPGQGGQWVGMGRQLLDVEPAFFQALSRCEEALRPHTGWSLLDLLHRASEEQLERIDVVQPVLFAVQVALAELWRSLGVEPDGVVGHSMGEVAAAVVAGALDLDQAARVICLRSRLMKQVSGKGAMLVVGLDLEQARAEIEPYRERVSAAVSNSRSSTVLSGDPEALAELAARLQGRGVFCRPVKVDVASHSPQMEPLRPELERGLAGLQPRPAGVAFYSPVTAGILPGERLTPEYWGSNLRQPVLFSGALERALADGMNTFIEINPHPLLLGPVQQVARDCGQEDCLTLPSMLREEDEESVLLRSLGDLYQSGYEVSWDRFFPSGGRVVTLPAYPWQRSRYWFDAPGGEQGPGELPPSTDLPGEPVPLSGPARQYAWDLRLDPGRFPWLFDHSLHRAPLLPASAFLEILRSAARQVFGDRPLCLSGVRFVQALYLSEEGEAPWVQTSLAADGSGGFTFRISTRKKEGWVLHVKGTLRPLAAGPTLPARPRPPELSEGGPAPMPGEQFYARLENGGITYGEALRSLEGLYRSESGAAAVLKAEPSVPLLLDPLFQLTTAAYLDSLQDGEAPAMPARLDELVLYSAEDPAGWCAAREIRPQAGGYRIENLALYSASGLPLAAARGLSLVRPGKGGTDLAGSLYTLRWEPAEPAPVPDPQPGLWLFFEDRQGYAAAIARRLPEAGIRPVLVSPGGGYERQGEDCFTLRPERGEDLRRLLAELESGPLPLRRVIYGWSLDVPGGLPLPQAFEPLLESGLRPLLELLKASGQSNAAQPPRLWLLTRGAQAVEPGSGVWSPAQAAFWGLGRVIAAEQGENWGGLIDLEPDLPPQVAAGLVFNELAGPGEEDQVAFSGGRRHVLRLERLAQSPAAVPYRWDPGAAYLITGGLGSLGLETARWMVTQGARHLILVSRTPLPPRQEWSRVAPGSEAHRRIQGIRQLEALGADMHLPALDAADPAQLGAFLNRYREEGWPPIRVVVHAAAEVRDALLSELEEEDFRRALRPKALGAWELYRLLPELDFFVSFSSIGSFLGLVGQGAYAAANCVLDALALEQRAAGLRALSVNWGVWTGLGLALTPGGRRTLQYLEAQGLSGFSPDFALEALESLLARPDGDLPGQAALLPADWEQFRDAQPGGRIPPLLKNLLAQAAPENGRAACPGTGGPAPDAALEIRAAGGKEARLAALTGYLQNKLAQILRMPAAQIKFSRPLGSLGLDSLMGVELRNQIQADLGLQLSATFIWNYPTLNDMAAYLEKRLAPASESAPQAAAPDRAPQDESAPAAGSSRTGSQAGPEQENLDELLSGLQGLSDEDALRKLMNRK